MSTLVYIPRDCRITQGVTKILNVEMSRKKLVVTYLDNPTGKVMTHTFEAYED